MNELVFAFLIILTPVLIVAIFFLLYWLYFLTHILYTLFFEIFLVPLHSDSCTCDSCNFRRNLLLQNQNQILELFRSDFLNPQLIPDLIDDNGTYPT